MAWVQDSVRLRFSVGGGLGFAFCGVGTVVRKDGGFAGDDGIGGKNREERGPIR